MEPPTKAISIRPLLAVEEMRRVEEIQKEVWGFTEREIVPVVELISAAKAEGCLAGAFLGEEMVGFVFGVWGYFEGAFYHYSRMLGVKRALRGSGIGLRLKFHQRDHCLARGVPLMRWTFDPLEGPNASLNVRKLGVVADAYIEDYYGQKRDALNRGLPTDRYFVKWVLDSDRVKDRAAGRTELPSIGDLLASPSLLAVDPNSEEPRVADPHAGAGAVHMEIPGDTQAMKGEDMEKALRWRMAVRRASQAAFGQGYRIEEFASGVVDGKRRSAYLLRKRD